jgi:hypothetical protein
MRWFPALLISCALGATAFAADVSFARVWPEWRNADAFDRIREYFGGPENDGRETVVRTHTKQRAGMYFVVRVNSAVALPNAKFVLEVIRPDSPEVRSYSFPVSLPAKSHVAELGLTGEDWPAGRGGHPVAWKLSLVNSAGNAVATSQSFLWQMPGQ